MTKVKIRSAYQPRERVPTDCGLVRMTKQEFKDECDINNIVKKFERDQLVDHVMAVQGRYGDFGEAGTFHEAMNTVRDAQEMFESVPAAIRAEFGNDPGAFLDWAINAPDDELRERGLMPPASVDPAPGGAPGAPAVDPDPPIDPDPGPVAT